MLSTIQYWQTTMKTLFSIFISLLSFALYAQPQFTSLVVPGNGSSGTSTGIVYLGSVPSGGADQTWDYSALDFPLSSTSTTTLLTDVASTPYAASFPSATHYISYSGDSYAYYTYTSTAQQLVGYYIGTEMATYSIPGNILFDCPIDYTDVQTESYAADYTTDTYTGTINGTTTFSYIGYGTLITELGTTDNIGMFKRVIDEIRTEDRDGLITRYHTIYEVYFWQLPLEPFDKFTIIYRTTYENDVFVSSSASASLMTNSVITSATGKLEPIEATLYPQPASENVYILSTGIEGKCTYAIYKMDGGLVKREEITEVSMGEFNISLSGISSGLYMIEISNENKIIKQKLVVK